MYACVYIYNIYMYIYIYASIIMIHIYVYLYICHYNYVRQIYVIFFGLNMPKDLNAYTA